MVLAGVSLAAPLPLNCAPYAVPRRQLPGLAAGGSAGHPLGRATWPSLRRPRPGGSAKVSLSPGAADRRNRRVRRGPGGRTARRTESRAGPVFDLVADRLEL